MQRRRTSLAPVALVAAVAAIALAACSERASGPSVLLRWKLSAGESLVYRYELERKRSASGKQHTEGEHGELRIDGTGNGQARLGFEPARAFAMMPESELALSNVKSSLLFPLPPFPLTAVARSHAWLIKGLGGASNVGVPAYEVKDSIRLRGVDGSIARLAWTRVIAIVMPKVTKSLQAKQTITEQGEGSFDLSAGRYTSVSTTQQTDYEIGPPGQRSRGTISGSLRLALDAALSRQRTASRKSQGERGARVTPQELADYLRDNPRATDLRRVVDEWSKTQNPAGTPALVFHLRAHPRDLWTEGLASQRSAKQREAFVRAMSLQAGGQGPLPEDVVALLRARTATEPALQRFVAQQADARLAPLLQLLSRAKDAVVAQLARRSLADVKAHAGKLDPRVLLALGKDPRDFVTTGLRLLAGGADPKKMAEVLIGVLTRVDTAAFNKQLCVQWLEAITCRALGKDAAAWQVFWQRNQARPYGTWLAEAARQGSALLQINALLAIARQRPYRAGLSVLLDGLQSKEPRVRLQAASTLARWHDGRSVPVLLAFLEHALEPFRQAAFVELSAFHDTTLGYRPGGKEEARRAAVRRWRAWAAGARQLKPVRPEG